MSFLPVGKKLSDLLPEQLKSMESFEDFNTLLDEAFLPFINDVLSKGLENIRVSQDINLTNFPIQLGSLFGIPVVVSKDTSQILPRVRAQVKVLPYSFLHKGLQKSILLYLKSVGLTGIIIENAGLNSIDLDIFERYILGSFVFRNVFNDFNPIIENVKKLLPVWTKLNEARFAGIHVIHRLSINADGGVQEFHFFVSLEWVSHRIVDRGICVGEANGFDLPDNIWDPPPNQGLIFDGTLIQCLNLPPDDFLNETDLNVGLSGTGTASWTLDHPKIIGTTFTFTINDGVNTYMGIDDGNGNIVNNGGTGTVTGGTIDYLTGVVSITVMPNFAINVDANSKYRFTSVHFSFV